MEQINVKGLTNHLHNIFSASKLQDQENDEEDSFIIPYTEINQCINGPLIAATIGDSILM